MVNLAIMPHFRVSNDVEQGDFVAVSSRCYPRVGTPTQSGFRRVYLDLLHLPRDKSSSASSVAAAAMQEWDMPLGAGVVVFLPLGLIVSAAKIRQVKPVPPLRSSAGKSR